MNDLSNMPIVTPMNDSQWVPDGSGEVYDEFGNLLGHI